MTKKKTLLEISSGVQDSSYYLLFHILHRNEVTHTQPVCKGNLRKKKESGGQSTLGLLLILSLLGGNEEDVAVPFTQNDLTRDLRWIDTKCERTGCF